MQLDRDAASPLYVQLETILRERIQSGTLPPGTKLASEAELAAEFGVGRSTVRKVLERLVLASLITKWPGKGSFVAGPRLSLSPSTLSFQAQMTAAGHTVTTRVLLREVIAVPQYIAEALHLPVDSRVIHFRRLRILDGEPAAIHSAYLPFPTYGTITANDLLTQSLSAAMASITGVRVVHSHDVLRVGTADAKDAALLNIAMHSPLILLRGVAYAASGLAVRYAEGQYRSDRFDFVVNNVVPDRQRSWPGQG